MLVAQQKASWMLNLKCCSFGSTRKPQRKKPHRHGENKLTPHRVLGIDPIAFFWSEEIPLTTMP